MCYIGERLPQPHKIERNCPCGVEDFEWSVLPKLSVASFPPEAHAIAPHSEFNYKRNDQGTCVLVDGAKPLESDSTCEWDQPFWYERTSVRKVPHSSCEGGLTLDRGSAHACPAFQKRGWFFWATITVAPFIIAGLAAVWWTRRRSGKGRIRLPEPGEGGRSGLLDVVVSIPWFVVGVVGVVWAYAKEVEIPWVSAWLRARTSRGGYRTVRIDDDAALLRDYDDEEE